MNYTDSEERRGSNRNPLSNVPMDDTLDIGVRHGFIRKVFGILGVQLLITAGIAAPFMFIEDKQAFKNTNYWLIWVAMGVFIGFTCIMCCCDNLLRKTPINYLILLGFTAAEGVLVGFSIIEFTTESVMYVFAITGVITVGLMCFAMQTKFDFTGAGPYLFVACLVLMCFGIISMFTASTMMHNLIAAGGAFLMSMYIVYDTQLIVGGKNRQFAIGIDDYVMAAISIYLDIVQLFLYLLQLFGNRD